MNGSAPSWLLDASLWAASITAVIIFVKVLTGWGPFQFVWKHLVRQPATDAMGQVVREQVTPMLTQMLHQVLPNNGESFRDAVDQNGAKLDEFMAYQHEKNHDIINTVMGTRGRVMRVEQTLAECKDQMEATHSRVEDIISGTLRVKSDLIRDAAVVKAAVDEVADDLAASQVRADAVPTGEPPGVAADAGARSEPDEP